MDRKVEQDAGVPVIAARIPVPAAQLPVRAAKFPVIFAGIFALTH